MAPKNHSKRWIVKDVEGRIFGPFSTEQVLEQIERNYFLGGEQVAPYPGGDWIPISKAPEFYDRLLDVLAEEVKSGAAAAAKPASGPSTREATTVRKTRTAQVTGGPSLPIANSVTTPSALNDANQNTTTDHDAKSENGQVIELTDLQKVDRIKQLKESRLPLMIIAVGLLALVGMLLMPDLPGGDKRFHLLVPRKNQDAIPPDRLRDKFRRAIGSFQTDTFKGYQRAENELIEVIEGASPKIEDGPKKAEYLSFLCLTYRELWPFAYQDDKDMKAVTLAMQEAKRIDPGGLHGSICELVHLMLNGRIRDAQGLTEAVLLEKSQSPVLFEIRGDLFAKMKDYQNAANYFYQGRNLWAGWQKSAVEEARSRAELKQYSEAEQIYRGVIQKVSDHGVAKIELGLIDGLQFNRYDKAISLISAGVEQPVPRTIAARGYLGLAQIYDKKQQKRKALSAASKAFELDPTNPEIKAFLVNLGGKPNSGPTDWMFLCEEYMQAGDYYRAQANCKGAYDANKKNGMAAMKAAKCLWQLNQSTDAIDWMRKAIHADPRLVEAYVELADYYAQRFDYFSAMEVLRQAQAIQGNGFEVMRGFATVEFRRNNFNGAIGYGKRALKLYETDIETLLLMAKAYAGLQQFPEAQKYAARVIDLDYNNIEGHSIYAKIEAGLHGVDSGANYIQQMLNKYVITQGRQVPQAAIDLRITMGEIFMQDERYKQAEDLYRQAIGLDPNSKRALIALGKVLQAENQASFALEYFLKAAVLDPSDAEPIYASGMLYADTGKVAEAAKQFERVLKINSRYPKAHTALGRVALKRGDTKKALEEALQERTMNPDLADSYTLAAEAYFGMHQYSNCAGEYQKAVQKAGQSTVVLVRMARCSRLAGALEAAQSLLRQAITIESGNPEIYKEQGAIFQSRSVPDEAIASYETYLRLAPNASDKAEVETRIRKIQNGDMSLQE